VGYQIDSKSTRLILRAPSYAFYLFHPLRSRLSFRLSIILDRHLPISFALIFHNIAMRLSAVVVMASALGIGTATPTDFRSKYLAL
jgi:hypothetical protein